MINSEQQVVFLKDLHLQFIKGLDDRQDRLDYWMLDHLRMSGVYWALTSCCLLGHDPKSPDFDAISPLSRKQILDFIKSCRHPSGSFSGNVGLDGHLLFTYSAIQILTILDELNAENIDADATVNYIKELQQEDGSFCGDEFGENDTRFLYCAVASLSLLGRLDNIDRKLCVEYLQRCMNFDGGFGVSPGCESHAGQSIDYAVMLHNLPFLVFCCVAALQILGRLDIVDRPKLLQWLAFRQLPCGGLNGRPQKLEDVCYSWWVLSALHILSPSLHQISKADLTAFIMAAQDRESGGISDRPGDLPDIFHTLFGIAGLSLMGHEGFEAVDPAYCMPVKSLKHIRKL